MTFDSQNKMNIKITTQDVLKTLTAIQDPDLHRDIVSLGFVKDVQVADSRVSFTIELTTPACPLGPVIKTQAHAVVTNRFPAVNDVDINLVWTPRWDPRIHASEEAKAELGIW